MSNEKVVYKSSGISILDIWFFPMLFLFIFTERSYTESMKWPIEAYQKITQEKEDCKK